MNSEILNVLLRDRTTGKNILWANGEHGAKEIQAAQVYSIVPRYLKVREQQKQRTRDRAEIFTPPDICKLQNDLADTAWLRSLVAPWLKEKYNLADDSPTDKAIADGYFEKIAAAWFGQNKISPSMPDTPADTVVAHWLTENNDLWQNYVTSPRLEITCGEAPYLVSRYNTVTGDAIPLAERNGLLDRKLRVVDNTKNWSTWTLRAVQSVYGYDFQGDNLFLARRNVFDTVVEYFAAKFNRKPPENFWLKVAEIISWNLWQMDGRTNAIPYANASRQGSLSLGGEPQGEVFCKIKDWRTGKMDWRTGKVVEFINLTKGGQ